MKRGLALLLLIPILGCGEGYRKFAHPKTIVFFGDSLTYGKGVTPETAYPTLIQKKINELGWDYTVINAGVSGNTSADGVRRLPDFLKQHDVDVFILALGANDMMRKQSSDLARKNLQDILNQVKAKNKEAKLVVAGVNFGFVLGMFVSRQFQDVFKSVAKKNNAVFIPNLLDGVVGKTQYNTSDGIHPNAEGHKIIAETVWDELKDVL